jgi:hypothetical protein
MEVRSGCEGDLRPPQRSEASMMLMSGLLAKVVMALSRAGRDIVPMYYQCQL